ncbi:hypothetical protein MBOU_52980 [Mycobacterium bourgelatii]|uniref:DUF4232 domain-containing protein n=1 Tax=Mycobacterium bourgelatii TaxID=1273442 RepID=A0A7I9YXI2_MYCBU|nr:hypothetical protein MBOU_52980 [Mycobacterium bourgelatii]
MSRPLMRQVTAVAAVAGCAASGATAWVARADDVNFAPPCPAEKLAMSADPAEAAAGHRGVTLTFTLIADADACTLTGYPQVHTGAGGPLVQAEPTLRGYMGGLPAGTETPPAVTLMPSQQARAVVEGMATDGTGKPCPTYTELLVAPPNSTTTVTLPVSIEACQLQVHPVSETAAGTGRLPSR